MCSSSFTVVNSGPLSTLTHQQPCAVVSSVSTIWSSHGQTEPCPNCVCFSFCSPPAFTSAAVPRLRPLQVLLLECIYTHMHYKSIINMKVEHHCCSPAPQTSQFHYTQTDTHLKSQYSDDTAPGSYTPAPSCSHLQSRNLESTRTVAVNKKFTFRFRSTIVLRSFYDRSTVWVRLKKWCEIVFTLVSCAPFLQISSVVIFLSAYTKCSLRPTVFYLGYALGPESLSLLVFVWCP